jgi:hypothetical protein
MPTYCYQEEKTGRIIERVFPIGSAPKEINVCGKVARRSFAAENKGFPPCSGWPMTCVASGVNASQAGELREFLSRKGVPTEVTKDGDPVYRDSTHRKKALKARGLFDKSSYV